MMTPAIQAMYELSGEKIDFCVPEWNDSRRQPCIDLLNAWDIVNEVVDIPKKEYDMYFSSRHCEYGQIYDIFRRKQKTATFSPNWKANGEHETEYYMRHARAAGFKGDTPSQFAPIKEIETGYDPKRLTIGLCNGFFNVKMWTKKAWPHFKQLAYYLRRYFNCEIVKLGSGKELSEVDADHDFVGKLTLPETAYAISKLDLFITTDTGNMHIGDALGVNMIALFGGTLLSKNKPLSPQSHVLTANVDCVPCQCKPRFHSCKDYECMRKLYVGDVLNLSRRIINGL